MVARPSLMPAFTNPESTEAAIEWVNEKDDAADQAITAACHYVLGDADGDRRDPSS